VRNLVVIITETYADIIAKYPNDGKLLPKESHPHSHLRKCYQAGIEWADGVFKEDSVWHALAKAYTDIIATKYIFSGEAKKEGFKEQLARDCVAALYLGVNEIKKQEQIEFPENVEEIVTALLSLRVEVRDHNGEWLVTKPNLYSPTAALVEQLKTAEQQIDTTGLDVGVPEGTEISDGVPSVTTEELGRRFAGRNLERQVFSGYLN
jgi:hypothetical protein